MSGTRGSLFKTEDERLIFRALLQALSKARLDPPKRSESTKSFNLGKSPVMSLAEELFKLGIKP